MTSYRVSVDELSLYDAGTGRSLHYEHDHDLRVNVKPAIRGGDQAALILIELGIDGGDCHQARLDIGPCWEDGTFCYEKTGDEVRAITDAIDTLAALRDQLARICDQNEGVSS